MFKDINSQVPTRNKHVLENTFGGNNYCFRIPCYLYLYFLGTYSSLGVTLLFIRRYEFYLIQIYAPSVLVVMLSWLSFWLDVDAIPARISLGILTVLTISSNGNMSVSMAQRVSYIRAIDIWNSVCLILVFCAVMEYAYVCVSVRVHQRRKSGTSSSDIEICNNNKHMKVCNISDTNFNALDAQLGNTCLFYHIQGQSTINLLFLYL